MLLTCYIDIFLLYMKNLFKKYPYRIILLVGLVVIISTGFTLKATDIIDKNEILINFFGYSLTIYSIAIAAMQFRQTNLWQK